jgi:hypothetical protein
MNRIGHLFDFLRVWGTSTLIFSGALACFCCLTQFERPRVVAHDFKVCQWGVIESGRMADWAAQLPVGEARREGIIGVAIV